jgi:hypothetical protein
MVYKKTSQEAAQAEAKAHGMSERKALHPLQRRPHQ